MPRKSRKFAADFETTVYEGQETTEVWASALVELYTDNVMIFGDIDSTFQYLVDLHENLIIYYHNLKFDGTFWLYYLMFHTDYTQAFECTDEETGVGYFKNTKCMPNKSYKYSISDRGQWYTITIRVNDRTIEIRDSLKLLPFSIAQMGKSFGTKHQKSTMEYTGFRYPNCPISDDERTYLSNDVLVLKEGLEIMYNAGHDKLTIGSCCLSEFRRTIKDMTIGDKDVYEKMFPNLYEIPLDSKRHGCKTVGDWIHKSYRGGWCYLVPEKATKIYHHGYTLDVNSLYPSVMSSESHSRYPIGIPKFWTGNYIPDEATEVDKYFFIHIRTRFNIKDNYLPFIQIKNNIFYRGTESLKTSDIYKKNSYTSWKNSPYAGKFPEHFTHYTDFNGQLQEAYVDLYMTQTDYYLFLEHYDTIGLEIVDGCYFKAVCGLFDDYLYPWKEQKMNSTGAKREEAKLFQNNLYGKMASSTDSSFKVCVPHEDGTYGFYGVTANEKEPGYIPIGSAITSYARNFTIRAAQKCYNGPDKAGFIYADTDSMHGDWDEVPDVPIHPTDYCHWKVESEWDLGWFVRQKTYIEHQTENNRYNVKCAGMPDKCKDLFITSVTGEGLKDPSEYTPLEREYLFNSDDTPIKRNITDFKVGLFIPTGKLIPTHIKGGTLLVDSYYTMRPL